MIFIGKPYIEQRGEETFLCALIKDEGMKKEQVFWYAVDNQYGDYLCDDYADAFVLMVLLVAVRSGQDIKVEAPVSYQFLHNIHNTLAPVFVSLFPGSHAIHVEAPTAAAPVYNAQAVGCGCSLGVDSFHSFLSYYGEDKQKEYRITHLALFNSGQLGYFDVEQTEKVFREAVEGLKPFAAEVGLPIVGVDTNLNEYYNATDIKVTQSVVCRTMSCVLALQKLFGRYIYASSCSLADFHLSTVDQSYVESVYVPLLGTHNTEIVLPNPMMTRVDKTEFISRYPIVERYLDVCWASQIAYGRQHNTTFLEEKKNKNCGRCDKCMRTLLTLDLLGRLEPYGQVFDMDHYRSHKNQYLVRVMLNTKKKPLYIEINDLIRRVGYVPPMQVRLLVWVGKRFSFVLKIHRKLRRR